MKKKRYLLLLVILGLILLLPACGKNGQDLRANEIDNNGGQFIKQDQGIYFRKYNETSFEEKSLWNDFIYQADSWSEIALLKEGSREERSFDDNGFGGLYLYRNKEGQEIFLLNRLYREMDENGDYDPQVYSEIYGRDLEGERIGSYGYGSIFALDQERGLILVEKFPGALSLIDLESGQEDIISEAYHRPIYYDSKEGLLYCEDASGGEDSADLVITRIDLTGKEERILALNREDLNLLNDDDHSGDYYKIKKIEKKGQDVFITIGGYGGTANHFYSALLVIIDADDLSYKAADKLTEADWYALDKPFTYREDGPFFLDDPSYYMLSSEKKGEKIELLNQEDLSFLDLEGGDIFDLDYFKAMDYIEYVDGKVFFSISSGIRDQDEDIGWRLGYQREETKVYQKDLASGKIEKIYSY